MKILIIKSLLTSLYQREGNYPSLVKRGEGRFFNNVVLLITALVIYFARLFSAIFCLIKRYNQHDL